MLNLNEMIQTVQAEDAERERRKKAAAEQEKAAARDQALADFEIILNAEFTSEFRAALDMQVDADYWYERWNPKAAWTDSESGVTFTFSVASGYGVPRYTITGKHSLLTNDNAPQVVVVPGQATVEILRMMATLRERVANRRQTLEQTRAREAAEKQYRAEQVAAAQQVDQEIRAKLAELKATTPLSWAWKPGATITFYVMSWATGAVAGEGGEISADYDAEYTLVDELDEHGYITVINERGEERTIKLDMIAHKPVWQRLTASSIEGIPQALTRKEYATLPGVTAEIEWGYDDVRRVKSYHYAENDKELVEIGVLPVQWVRGLVDRA